MEASTRNGEFRPDLVHEGLPASLGRSRVVKGDRNPRLRKERKEKRREEKRREEKRREEKRREKESRKQKA